MSIQLLLFDEKPQKYLIKKPIRLIELFAGIGSQAMALRDIGADFEHYRVVEFDRFAVASYNAIHGTEYEPTDIRDITGADLGICDTDKYSYIMTYSFPCQDLSAAGKRKGMRKGAGTRSGLLWEVERLLNECKELPHVLLMENVPQVHSKMNMQDFQQWTGFLASKGYSNYWQDLNAKDYGIPQSRNRCFMVSILGEYSYEFPTPKPMYTSLKSMLQQEVDEKYFVKSKIAGDLVRKVMERTDFRDDCDYEMSENFNQRGKVHSVNSICRTILGSSHAGNVPKVILKSEPLNAMPDGTARTIKSQYYKNSIQNFDCQSSYGATAVIVDVSLNNPKIKSIANTIETRDRGIHTRPRSGNFVMQIGNICQKQGGRKNPNQGRVYDTNHLSPTLNCMGGGNRMPFIVSDKLTETATTEKGKERGQTPLINHQYRIRKLTPLECWRLMGFSDADFDKAAAVNSNTQLYKQAGNSIVKNVLMAIFAQMIELAK